MESFGAVFVAAVIAFAAGIAWLAICYAKNKTHARRIIDWADKAFKK
jgi:hypothetical protein